jgi:putative transposase
MLKWKPPREYRSLTYNQSGFELKNTSGRPTLWLSKIGEIPIHLHRDIPENATVKQVTIKREGTGEWYATFGIDVDEATPEKPENPENVVGIDVGILKYAHDTDGYAIESPDFSEERERLERAQRDLSRKEHGSANWEKQRRVVAERHANLKRKRRDFLHKLSNHYAREYDLVAVEDLDEGTGRTPRQLAESSRRGVGGLPVVARIQVRARGNALCRGESKRDDQGVRVLRCLTGEAAVGTRTHLSSLWV